MKTRRAAVNHLHADGQLAEFQLSFLARVLSLTLELQRFKP